MTNVVVRRGGTPDIAAASSVLALAFTDYPWTRWTVDASDHVARVRGLQRLALTAAGVPYGELWVAELDGAIVSAAVWMDSAVAVPASAWADVSEEQADLEGDRHDAAVAAERAMAGMSPRERHFYLATVGTLPEHQRRGIGRAVLAPALAQAEKEGVPAYLETSSESNVAFYAAIGFTVTERRDLPDGGPSVWAMVRPSHG